MPCLSISFSPTLGPLLQVAVFPPGGGPGVGAPSRNFTALVDTGASCTSVSRAIINTVGLLPVGKQSVGGIHGMRPANVYHFEIALAFPPTTDPSGTIQPKRVAFSVIGAEFIPGQSPFDVLLGRDILWLGNLTMTFDGRMTFCV